MTHETTEAFLARGGKIKHIPYGVSGLDERSGLTKTKAKDYRRSAKKGGRIKNGSTG